MAQKNIKSYFVFAMILAFIVALAGWLIASFDYQWDWLQLSDYFNYENGLLIQGLLKTLQISITSIIGGTVLGFILCLASMTSILPIRWLAKILIEIVRGTPLLVQLFIIYFILGTVLQIESGFACAAFSLSLFSACYVSEILRSGIQAIPQGQRDAAHILGLNSTQTMIYIILPQALKISLPALTGTYISLIKDTSLVSVLAIMDLTKAGREIISNTFAVFETWIIIAIFYLALTYPLSVIARKMEAQLDKN